MEKVGHGIVGWSSTERRSNRYGSINLGSEGYSGNGTTTNGMNVDRLLTMRGKRVKVMCKVIEARDSAHIGDHFLNIMPTTPDVGEDIVVGVGVLDLELSFDGVSYDLVLRPNDGREELWIDPRVLYRLHDQTVDLYIKETEEDFSSAPRFDMRPEGVIANGDSTFQVKGVSPGEVRLAPKVRRLGEGLFSLSMDYEEGERIDLIE
jgi:hypothetical protein